jgi:two-component system, LytTR family, sensor kinase
LRSAVKYWFCLAIFAVLPLAVYPKDPTIADKKLIDSLFKILPSLQDDTNKVNVLSDIASRYFTYDPDKGILYGNKCYDLATKLGWQRGVAYALNALATNYYAKNDLIKAQECYLKSLKIFELVNDRKRIAKTTESLGNIYCIEHNYPKTIEYYKRALAIAEEIKDSLIIAGVSANVSEIYNAEDSFENAVAYINKSITLANAMKRKREVAYYSDMLGTFEGGRGYVAKALNDEFAALTIYRELSKTVTSDELKDNIAKTIKDIGDSYLEQHNAKLALAYYRKAFLKYSKVSGIWARKNAASCLESIGETYYSIANTAKKSKQNNINGYTPENDYLQYAVDTLNIAIKVFKSAKDWIYLTQTLQCLSNVHELKGDVHAALNDYRPYDIYKDSMLDEERDKQTIIHNMAYEFDRKKDSLSDINKMQAERLLLSEREKKLNKLQSKQQWGFFIGLGIVFFLIAFLIVYRYRIGQLQLESQLLKERNEYHLNEIKQRNSLSQATLTALISQMNPHFIFNALNTIQSYIYTNDKKSASYYLGRFSELTRKILDDSNKEMISLDEEIALFNLYIDIEKARFGDLLKVDIQIDPNLDREDIFFPPMLVQPHVENAIKHGLLHKTGEKILQISIDYTNNKANLKIVIDDNGIGRAKSMAINKQKSGHQSFATTASQQRINLINNVLGKKIDLNIIDKVDNDSRPAGTMVIITIPIMHEQTYLTV